MTSVSMTSVSTTSVSMTSVSMASVSMTSVSMTFPLEFGTILTVWYFHFVSILIE